MSEHICDLLYCTESDAKDLIGIYPDARIKDASDFIHEERFSFELDIEKRIYLKDVIRCGLASVSLMCQLAIMSNEDRPMVQQIVDELKAQEGAQNDHT